MSELVPYPAYQQSPSTGTSLKEKLGYTIVLGIGVGVALYFASKKIRRNRATNADAKSLIEGAPQTLAKQIKMALENKWDFGPDTKTLRTLLTGLKTKAELQQVTQAYKNLYSTPGNDANMNADMEDKLKSTEYTEMVEIIAGKPDKTGQVPTATQYRAWARRIKAGFDRKYTIFNGTDQTAIQAVFYEIPTQQAFVNVGTAYQREFHTPIISDLKSELGSNYYTYMAIIPNKRKN